jgi:hypothetical protein
VSQKSSVANEIEVSARASQKAAAEFISASPIIPTRRVKSPRGELAPQNVC